MASLQSSCTVLSTNSISIPRISPFPSKPSSHLLPNARRSRPSHISCNGGADKKEGKLDRRNMLLGIGGLYGAANLISDPRARADPIQPPDLTTCSNIAIVNGDELDAKCCPPMSDTIIDYTLPTVTQMRVRPAAHKLHERRGRENKEKYEEAIRRMRALDITDPSDPRGFMQQANVHCAYCNSAYDQIGFTGNPLSIHFSWLFFPFHRWYLYFYERILGSLIDDPTFALPFWNWDSPRGMKMPKIFINSPYSPLYDANRNPEHLRRVVDLSMSDDDGSDDLQRITNNMSVMYNEMIRSVDETVDFMGQPYQAGDEAPGPAKGGTSERGSHTAVHKWVGNPKNKYNEDLGNFYSAGRDPAFYCHHANVDRMWTIWRSDLIKTKDNVAKDIKHPDYLNAAFLFYDEKKQLVRVKASDCLDYQKMGYEYEKVDIPWLNYRPPRRAGRVPIEDLSKGAQHPENVFPLTLNKITRVLVSKSKIGKVDEVLVLEDIVTNPRKLIKFDVYVNDEDDYPQNVDRAEYAGTFSQLPHRGHLDHTDNKSKGSIRMSLKELYEDIDIGDDDTIVVTIVPRISGPDVTIGGIKIIQSSSAKPSAAAA